MPRRARSGPKPEKAMSSRLLTMKFMQRAAATAATKGSSEPSSNNGSNVPTPKKVRLSTGPDESPAATPSSELEAISAALAAEEDRRREAISRQAAEAGETEWVLDFGEADTASQYAQQPPVVADYSLDAEEDDIVYGGRQSYGNFKRKKSKAQYGNDAGANEAQGADGDLADPESVEAMINNAKDKAMNRRVDLSRLTSISGGRHTGGGGMGGNKPQKKRKHK